MQTCPLDLPPPWIWLPYLSWFSGYICVLHGEQMVNRRRIKFCTDQDTCRKQRVHGHLGLWFLVRGGILFNLEETSALFSAFPFVWVMAAAATGACMASFGGVLVDRMPHSAGWRTHPEPGINLLTPSRCNACSTRVGIIAGIPVLGWLLLRGRCNHCRATIPFVYPLIEGIAALLSAAWAGWSGPTAGGILGLLVLWACIILSWIDWREGWLPDRILVPLLFLGLLYSPFAQDIDDRARGMALGVGVISAGFMWLSWRTRANMFLGGDIMFFATAGAWTGMQNLPCFIILTSLFYSATHLVLAIGGIKWQPADPGLQEHIAGASVVPMGPAIATALVCVLALGPLASLGLH